MAIFDNHYALQLSKKSFPLCMKNSHDILRDKHHLKYNGRLHYGLFLKAIGVTLEDSLKFFHDEFVKIMDEDRFAKQYTYGIRYNYGKEGSRINFSPYSCMKIITTAVGVGDTHGCPFKSLEQSALRHQLTLNGIPINHIQEIVNYASKGHYQIACTKYFEASHNISLDTGINHPNQYFEESQIAIGNRQRVNKPKNVYNIKSDTDYATQLLSQDNWDEELWNAGSEVDGKENKNTVNTANTIKHVPSETKTDQEWDDEFDVSMMEEF